METRQEDKKRSFPKQTALTKSFSSYYLSFSAAAVCFSCLNSSQSIRRRRKKPAARQRYWIFGLFFVLPTRWPAIWQWMLLKVDAPREKGAKEIASFKPWHAMGFLAQNGPQVQWCSSKMTDSRPCNYKQVSSIDLDPLGIQAHLLKRRCYWNQSMNEMLQIIA